jgi:steroid 5-alpha reductase family enzyme
MSVPAALGITLAVLVAYMSLGWLLSLIRKDAGVADPLWGMGFVVAAICYFFMLHGYQGRRILVLALVCLWGIRLAAYLVWRNHGRGEDRRYGAMRAKRPRTFWWYSLFQVFLLQAFLLWLVAAPIAAASAGAAVRGFAALDFIGLAVWLFGIAWEVVGDTQLALFKRDPANKRRVMQTGAWRYTRHPNYFGEAVLWWGIWLVAAAAGGYWSAYGPVVVTFLLLRVSGVTMLEKDLSRSKPGYQEYIGRTRAFIPWSPRRTTKPGQRT